MDFIPPPPADYNPQSSRLLIQSAMAGLEIENPFNCHRRLADVFLKDIEHRFEVNKSKAHSYYFDTPHLGLYHNGRSVRIRRGGVSTIKQPDGSTLIHQRFPTEFALKSRNLEWQKAAMDVARRVFPGHESLGIYPIVRTEIEGKIEEPGDLIQLRFGDLPQDIWRGHQMSIARSIEDLISEGKMEGVADNRDFVIQPWVSTHVKRRRTVMYLNPGQPYDFDRIWPSPDPTPEMQSTGKFLAVEFAFDKMVMRACPTTMPISEMMSVRGEGFRGCFSPLGRRSLIEYEIKPEKCGEALTDYEAILAYVEFGLALQRYANGKASDRHFGLFPTRSKATTTYGQHPLCQDGGRLYTTYLGGLNLAS